MPYPLENKTVLVTGATGFIGRHFVEVLEGEGASVRAFVRDRRRGRDILPITTTLVEGDVLDASSVAEAVRESGAVVHLANVIPGRSDTHGVALEHVNVDGTRNMVRAAAEAGVDRFVHVSSFAVHAAQDGHVTEDTPIDPGNDPYGRSKAASERVVEECAGSMATVVVRPTTAYGPHDPTWTLKPLRLIKKRALILPGGGMGNLQPIYVTDLVDGLLAALRNGRSGEAYLLAGRERTTAGEYFRRLAAIAGRTSLPSVPMPLALAGAGLMEAGAKLMGIAPPFTRDQVRYVSRRCVFDDTKARRELGYDPAIGLDTGMHLLDRWLREAGRI